MQVAKYDPAKELQGVQRGFQNFDSFLENSMSLANTDFNPSVNTRETKRSYHVEVDLPGVKKDDIKVDVKDNVITISGKRKTKKEVKEKDYYKLESSYGKFERSFTLPKNADAKKINVKARNGILEVVIHKLTKAKKKTPKKAKK